MQNNKEYKFIISLSILNELGRQLYRNFITVLGEAISNSWDADANNVWIDIADDKASFIIKDDGVGMTEDDFQNKFLNIGYSKREESSKSKENSKPEKGRPYIGRKGIGKLALLSCAEKISVTSKTKDTSRVGVIVDNKDVNKAMVRNANINDYSLEAIGDNIFHHEKKYEKGTSIRFEGLNNDIKNKLDYLEKAIALSCQFSLLDESFNIHLNGNKITHECLKELALKTQFLWKINEYTDPYTEMLERFIIERRKQGDESKGSKWLRNFKGLKGIKGFIASVEKPSDSTVTGTDIKVSIDLFVNGRLRERKIIKHIDLTGLLDKYFYGQIHYNALDEGEGEGNPDRFISGREGIMEGDNMHEDLIEDLKANILPVIAQDWNEWREKNKTTKEHAAKEKYERERYERAANKIRSPKGPNKAKVDGWKKDLAKDARYNFSAYEDCFMIENLMRRYIREEKISPPKGNDGSEKGYMHREIINMIQAGMIKSIRLNNDILSYSSVGGLAKLAESGYEGSDKNKDGATKDAKLDISTLEMWDHDLDALVGANENMKHLRKNGDNSDRDKLLKKLASLVKKDKHNEGKDDLRIHTKIYTPLRNVVAHTSLLTEEAKKKLNDVLVEIRGRLEELLE